MEQLNNRTMSFLSKRLTFLGPLIFLTVYLSLFIILRGRIPDTATVIREIQELYTVYGYYLVLIGAFFEGLFPIGMYIPGSTVVLLGAVLSKTGIIQFPLVIILGTLGFVLAYTANYFLGKYGVYRLLSFLGLDREINSAKIRLERNHVKAIFFGCISPAPAAFLSTAAGVLKIPFQRFLVLVIISQFFWSMLWGSIVYIFGMPLVEFILKNLFIIIGFIVIIWIFKSIRRKN